MALIGLADDLGVRLNNGRPGAKDGPRTFRAALARYGVAEPMEWDWPGVYDAGDIVPAAGSDASALNETHRRVTEAVAGLLEQGLLPVGIGGGHDLTFPFARPTIARFKVTSGVYFDAHTDVRETAGSGMAFRALVEECGIRKLHLHGASRFANSGEHLGWFRAHGGLDLDASDSLSASYQPPRGDLFVSVDLDVLDAAHAPGVSALNPAGWHPCDIEKLVQRLGKETHVRCFDIMELCPPHDEGGRTARVAAHLFLAFLRGFAERPA